MFYGVWTCYLFLDSSSLLWELPARRNVDQTPDIVDQGKRTITKRTNKTLHPTISLIDLILPKSLYTVTSLPSTESIEKSFHDMTRFEL